MYPADWRKQQKGLQNAGTILFAKDGHNTAGDMVLKAPEAMRGSEVPSSCPGGSLPIKGNIGKKSQKLFHVPGSISYDQVRTHPFIGCACMSLD